MYPSSENSKDVVVVNRVGLDEGLGEYKEKSEIIKNDIRTRACICGI